MTTTARMFAGGERTVVAGALCLNVVTLLTWNCD